MSNGAASKDDIKTKLKIYGSGYINFQKYIDSIAKFENNKYVLLDEYKNQFYPSLLTR